MIKVLILICAMTLGRTECQPDTARVVMQGPECSAANPMWMFSAQAFIANSAIKVAEDEWVKFQCPVPQDPRRVG